MLRHFETHIEALAQQCFDQPILDDTFIVEGMPEGGGTSSRRVRVAGTNQRAWAKPARIAPDNLNCVVNEKIASDLAFSLGLPVAPVQIIKRCTVPDFPPVVALSYSALPQPRQWGQVSVTHSQRKSLASVLGAMFAFHAWIDDHDHNWNDGNALLETSNDGSIRAVFIDYSFSLTRRWNPPAPAPDGRWGQRSGPYLNLDQDAAIATVEAIRQVALSELEDTIAHVPRDCLSEANASALAKGLHERGSTLRALLNF